MNTNEYNNNNTAKLIKSGNEYFDLLIKMIRNAKKNIHLQTYIFNNDDTGRIIANELISSAIKKIKVYIMVDGYASQNLSHSFIQKLTEAGVYFKFFNPVFKTSFFYFSRRLHHKLVVIDSTSALVGGLNIADRYNDTNKKKAWLDFAVLIEGETVKDLCEICLRRWWGNENISINECVSNSIIIPEKEKTDTRIRMNDWVWHKNEISASYIEMLRIAQHDICILCSYFLPGKVIRRQLVNAVKRGVKIKVITAGSSDIWFTKKAERWLYDWLIRNKIEVFEYQKNILHGKIAFYDNIGVTIGSYNINNLSAYASIELNVDIKNIDFSNNVKEVIDEILSKDCIQITRSIHLENKNFLKQFVRWCSYQFIRIVFNFFTFRLKRKA